jgi:MAS20 protein import receptor
VSLLYPCGPPCPSIGRLQPCRGRDAASLFDHANPADLRPPFFAAYVVYFDYNRRADPNFRRKLRRNERQQHRAEKDAAVEESARQRQTIKALVAEAKDEGYPSDTEGREAFFLQQVSEGETLSVDRESPWQYGSHGTQLTLISQPPALSRPPSPSTGPSRSTRPPAT